MSSGICILYDVYYVTGVFVQMYSMIIGCRRYIGEFLDDVIFSVLFHLNYEQTLTMTPFSVEVTNNNIMCLITQ